jgi:uncharacterized protein
MDFKYLNKVFILIFMLLAGNTNLFSQDKSLVNTSQSPYAKMYGVNMPDVKWTKGFWAERFTTCKDTMVPTMWNIFKDPEIAHSFRNFEIAAGLEKGEHEGPPFHDGDFYKWFEGMAMVYAQNKDPKLDELMDKIIAVIAKAQREDGYIHTPAIIKQKASGQTSQFEDKLNFETYNMGHLMTTACVHYRITGKRNMLNLAVKAADYLYNFNLRNPKELAVNAVCPAHYMGIIEMYRTTHDPKYLELAKSLIDNRGLSDSGTDDNQDRIPFRQQTKAFGHAVRANYLYAGVADVYLETGDTSLLRCLNLIWDDMVHRKMYITGACGALYDGTSPDGTSYEPSYVQKVHQSYGRDYQLPNKTAHNESCANIGNLLWNYRMLELSGDAKYADIMEQALYNSILAGVNLNGNKYFYTNPLAVSNDFPYTLRWSKDRETYIKLCNCCPPNTVRTIAEVSNYAYSLTNNGVYCNIYGSNELTTKLKDGSALKLTQETEYPWDGKIKITIGDAPKKEMTVYLRIPGWCSNAELKVNGQATTAAVKSGTYATLARNWKKGDVIELLLPMTVKLMESNPLVEETRNQVAVMRGPVVYCLESPDMPGMNIFNVALPVKNDFKPVKTTISNSNLISLEGTADVITGWDNGLYREAGAPAKTTMVRLIPYFAWDNRGKSEMTVWLPIVR